MILDLEVPGSETLSLKFSLLIFLAIFAILLYNKFNDDFIRNK